MKALQKKLMSIFESTVNEKKDLVYRGSLEEINHFNLLMEAGTQDALHKMFGCDMCMLNFEHEGNPSVLMIFSIPVSSNTGNKLIADRVMEIIGNIEECFTTVDYSHSKEQKLDKFIYVTIVKTLEVTN